MALHPFVVNTTIPYNTFTYDGVPNNVILRGTVIDVPPSSALATALSTYVTAMTTQQQQPGTSDSISPSGVSNLGGNAAFGGTGGLPAVAVGATGAGSPYAWPQ
jgi:hypothetical protein